MAAVSGFLAKYFKVEPIMMPGCKKLYFDWKVSCKQAEDDLDYSYRSLKDGLSETYAWLKGLIYAPNIGILRDILLVRYSLIFSYRAEELDL